jgi:hypothetical protein
MKDITDENVLFEIHHLTMAYKAVQQEEIPKSSPYKQDEPTVSYSCIIGDLQPIMLCSFRHHPFVNCFTIAHSRDLIFENTIQST